MSSKTSKTELGKRGEVHEDRMSVREAEVCALAFYSTFLLILVTLLKDEVHLREVIFGLLYFHELILKKGYIGRGGRGGPMRGGRGRGRGV